MKKLNFKRSTLVIIAVVGILILLVGFIVTKNFDRDGPTQDDAEGNYKLPPNAPLHDIQSTEDSLNILDESLNNLDG